MRNSTLKKRQKNGVRAVARAPRHWQLQDAKARFSELVRESRKAPQIITVHGQEVAVLESIDEYRKKNGVSDKRPNIFEALMGCPPGPDFIPPRNPNDRVPDDSRPIFGAED